MSKKRQRRLTIVGISTVLTVWIAALALLFSQPGAQSANHMLPTLAGPLEGVSSLPNTGGVSPTLLPTGLPVELPADSPPVSSSSNATQIQAPDSATTTLNIPSDPIPNSMVIRFKPEMTDQQRLDYIAALGGQIVQEIKPLNTVIINLPAKANAAAQAQTQRVNPGVVANEPDYYAGALLSPNDSLAAGQWGLNVVKAPQAWDLLPLPTPTITVAVIDSGICANHADLQGRIASDGWDFVQNDSTPQDEFGHGCAVSGIIAANSNNGLGIAGVAPNTAIMPLRVLDGSGIGRYSNVAAAIVYAVDNGAQVINMSLGGPNPSSILQDAVNYADAHGVTVIAAAGNAGTAQAYYPAAYPPVVAVGSVDQNLQRSAFSNYGPDVDLYAPGSNIMTTSLDGSFQTYSGTSVAAPYVTGVWALRKALGKSLVLDGGIVSAIYDNDVPAPTEQPPSEACVLTNFNEAESTYFDLVQQNATQPGSVSDDQLQTAKTTYLSVAGQCANALYDGTITIDGGALSPVGGDVAPQFQLFGHKWGSDSPFNPSRPPAAPVPPATPVTFSFMPTGVSLAEKEAENGGGPNAFITSIDQLPNNTTQCDLEGRIRQAFAAWSKVANISFVEIPQEARDATGAPIPFGHGAAGQVGDIRIGAQVIDGMKGELGHAYYPPPEDTDPASANIVRSGDIFLDRAEMWGCAPGETQINGETVRVIDIGLVALHEIGHALGMRHEAADQQLALMNPTYKAELLTPNDQFNLSDGIQPDDKSGIQGIYGALGVSAPTATFPVDNTDVNDNTPTFTWTDTTNNGSDYFEVQIYTNDGSNQAGGLVFDGTTDGDHPDAANPNAKAFTLQTVLESQSYVWRVRSFVTSDWGPWSTYQSFSVTVGIASLRRPVEGESLSNGTVNFEWSPIVGDNIFNLQIASRPEFSDPLLFEQDGIASTRFVLSTPLADGTYYWRVRGSNSNLFSRVGSFIVDSSAPVVDLSTGNGAVSPADDSSQPNQGVTLSWPTLSGIDEYQVQVDTSENFSGLLYLDRVFLDRVFLDRVFLDRVFLDRVFLDRVFLDRVFLDRVFLDRVFLDRVFLDRVFLDRVFLDRVFLDRVFLDRVFLDRVFLDRVFLDRYSLDKVFLDRVFLDRMLFDKVVAATGASSASVTLADVTGTQRISEGTHYWRVRAHLPDGTFGPWSVGRKFEVHTQATKVVINEIKLTDPSWVEFHNTGLNAADLTNWKFFAYGPDGATQLLYTFPDGFTLQPNGYVVLYEGQGTNTDRTLFTGGSQIDWPLAAQTTLDDPSLINQMGAVVPGDGATAPGMPNQPTLVMGPNGPLLIQGSSLTQLNLQQQPAPTQTSGQTNAAAFAGVQSLTSTPEANVNAQATATPAADVNAQTFTDPALTANPTSTPDVNQVTQTGAAAISNNGAKENGQAATYAAANERAAVTNAAGPEVTAQTDFNISIGDTISNGVPSAGAGNIETSGSRDDYLFNATAGQVVYFDVLAGSNSGLAWVLFAPDGTTQLFNTTFVSDRYDVTLTTAGTYRLVLIASTNNPNFTGTYSFKLWDVPAPQEFNINLGDTISNGVPSAGAGNIESPGVRDDYLFSVSAGQIVYFDVLAGGNSDLAWVLIAPDGTTQLFNTTFVSDRSNVTLTTAGTYRLILVSSTNNPGFTGTYSFKTWNVPAPQEFNINLGDTISNGVPSAGAGNIEAVGAQDVYTLPVTAGQIVYFQTLGASNSSIRWQVRAPSNALVFDTTFTGDGGRQVLTETGNYKLTAYNSDTVTGTYSFKVWSVNDQTFPINVGDTISNGVPGVGAGNIESPGAYDIYTFTGTVGQVLYFDILSSTNNSIDWELRSPTNVQLFGHNIGSDGGRIVLPANGTYSVNVFDYFGPLTGTYSFTILPVTDQTFPINVGDTISNGVPGVGAGNIESPGAYDIYTFTGTVGQVLYFDILSSTNNSIDWELRSPTNVQLFGHTVASDGGRIVLPANGTYSVNVFDYFGPLTGTYSFRVLPVTDSTFPVTIGDLISNGNPSVGAGNIESPGVKDIYTFTATAGQVVLFDALTTSNASIRWQLLNPTATGIFDTGTNSDGGLRTLATAGTYSIVVYSNSDATGTYSFRFSLSTSTEFAIGLGTTVSNNSPATGAGNITPAGNIDVYIFGGTAGQHINLDVLSGAAVNMHWRLVSPSDTEIFNTSFADQNNVALPETGTYTLRVQASASNPSFTGTYSFQLLETPLIQNFNISIGDSISNGLPSAGAGNIETQGGEDIYSFTASAGQIIYLDAISSSNGNVAWQLLNPSNAVIFDLFITSSGGRRVLPTAGTYKIRVYGYNNSSGTYSFKLWGVTDNNFAINVGDTISSGVPGTGAGNIEQIGTEDNYTFSVAAGQIVYFEALSSSNSDVAWRLRDPSSTQIFDLYLTQDGGRRVLSTPGTYTVNAYGYQGSTGTYSFRLFNVVDHNFAINLGDTISNGVPGAGAGNIETLGAEDNYTFSVSAGQTILFEGLNASDSSLAWRLRDPSSNQIFDLYVNSTSTQRTLNSAGTYTLNLYGYQASTGTYSFTLVDLTESAQPGPTFTVNSTAATDDGVCGILNCTLIEAINAANDDGVASTIELESSQTYTLLAVNNTDVEDGANGLPVISSAITIHGHNSTIFNNSGTPFRLFYVNEDGDLSLSNLTLQAGDAGTNNGGALFNGNSSTLNNVIVQDSQAGLGGGVYNADDAELTIVNSSLRDNRAVGGDGGALYNEANGSVSIDGSSFFNNNASSGAGIFNAGFSLTINDTTIEGNIGTGNGGGIYYVIGDSMTITNSTIANNTGVSGGGMYTQGNTTIVNSTIANNAAEFGGGIYDDGGVTINFVTITGNISGGVYTSAVLNAKNSIISGQASGSDCSGDVNDSGVNFSETSGCTGFLEGTPTQLKLGTLANNGGATETIELGIGSIAIDAASDCTILGGTTVTTDQRGAPRPQGAACDAGAFEAPTSVQTFAINFGDTVSDGMPAAGAGNIETNGAVDEYTFTLAPGQTAAVTPLSGGLDIQGEWFDSFNNSQSVFSFQSSYNTLTSVDGGSFKLRIHADPSNPTFNGTYSFEFAEVPDNAQAGPTFTVNSVTDNDDGMCGTNNCTLIEAITAANAQAGANTINLGSNQTYILSDVNNTDNDANGLPVISTEITINSNNSTIQRSNDDFTPEFRIFDVATTGNLTLNDALLGNGSTTEANGGIIDNRGVLLINNVILEDGFAYSGGAIYNDSSASATLHNSTMRDNRAISGAALVNAGTGTANIDGSSFFNNSAGLGGAIINDGTMTVNTSTFTGNMSTTDQGGAIANFATLTVNQSTFTNNTATTNGGAIDSSAFGAATTTLTITNSTLNNNTAASLGGAILNYADVASSMANLTVRNSTITGNSSPYGGGVANFGGTGTETATVEFSTIVGNQASSLAANLYNGASKTFNAKNLIVAQPAGSTNCDGVFTTDGPNFVDDASCNSFLQRTAPQLNLGTLANNGGPTQTIALGTGSVAIDSTDCNTFGSGGTALPTDQRGVTRPQGSACDAGAYEAALSDTAQPGPTFTVNTTAMNDDGMCGTANCTLIEAITASNMQSGANTIILGSGETYTLSVVNNNIDGPNALPDVTSAITINGNGATITRDSTGETPHFRLFHVSSSVTLDLANMYITNGYVDGANRGGAIFNKGTLTLNNVDVSGNTADSGGGLNIANGGYAGINASHIHNNTSSTLGGGFYVEAGGSATVDGTLIAHNNSAAYGGGLYADGGLSLNHVTITDNTAGGGAGMRVCCSGTINITNSNISNNTAASYGGGIMNLSLLLNIDSTTISGNVVTAPAGASFNGEGGGILNRQSGNVNLSNSTVSLNNAAVGAGIASDNSMTLINTSTIANNIGGGIFGDAGSSTGIALSTIVNNTVNPGIDSTGAVTISDSIVANNTAGDCNATLTAQGVNFATDATCNGFTQKTSGELNLQALANNGGSTQTIALGTGSAAIDTVTDCLGATVDQRGVERPQGPACDAGAYEAEISDTAQPGPTFTVNTTAMNDDGMCGTNNCTLIEAINAANAQAGANTIELNNGGADYVMDAVNNTTDGDNGLPNITSDITINAHLGNIRRNPSAIQFRLFHVASSGSLTINNAELIFGDADIYDGGVIYSDGTVTLNHVDVSYSRGSSGGAIRNGNGTLTINDSNFAINTASGAGGAIFNNTGTLTVNRTSFDSNTSAQNGGAIYNTNGGHTTLTRTAFSRNTALSGGALFNVIGSSVLKIINSTISGNYTNGSNSAALYNAATLRLSFVTIAYNNGGGLYNSGGVNWGLKNTIIAAQSSGANCAGTQLSVSEGANFANDATCSTLGITVTSGPLIDPIFSYNGLGLSVVHTLPSGSPAIDAVTDCTDSDDNAVTLDQRGLTRPQGANCDSGAFEVMGGAGTPTPTVTPPPGDTPQSGTNLVVNNSTDIDDGVCGVTNCSLREAINRANALPGANDITFNTGDSYPTIVLGGTELSVTTAITITPPVRAFINGNSLSRVFNIDVGGNLTLTNVDVFGGKAAQGAGILNANQLTLSGSQLYSNEATSSGSGLYNTGIVTVSGSNFYSNVAEFEGGAVTNNGVMTITNSYFYNNITTTNEPGATGGAIANNGDLTVTGTAFIANYVQNGGSIGGAIASSGNLTVDISLFQYNAAALGGAVYTNGEGIATFTNVTFSANSATTNGGGLYIAAPTNLSFVTIADNTGGGIYSDLVTYGVKNSVLARQASGANCAGTPPSGSGANFTDDASCGLVGFTNTATALIEGLAYNIGRVNTYALTQNSPARDAATDCTAIGGATVTTDSRDIARPQGATCDAGAYEFGGDLHVTTNKIIEDASDGLCSLPEAIKAANTGTTASGVNGECVPSGTSPEVITLGANQTYKLTQVNNTTQGPNGLPAITNPNVYLYMNNSTITRASDAPDFRIFYIAPGGSLYFTNTGTISGGHLSGTDKGAGILNQGSLTAGGLVFENHAAAGNGGAIYNDAGANTNLFGNILRGNQAEQGGAFYNVGTLTFNGGGYSNRFENNHATRGGALYNVGSANDLTASFINNQATDAGGAVYLDGGPLNLSNSTLSGNQAARGAAVFQNSGSGVITFSTIADNTTTGGSSGAVVANDGTTTLSNSILANNPGGNCAGLPTNGDHNLQFPGTSCGVGFAAANPLLSTRQEYGVSSYYPLLIGSPAIDAADNAVCPGYDNVSRARPVGAGCDIGSFEGNGEALTGSLTVTTTSMAINPSDGLCSLPEAINAANSDTAAEGAAQGECVPNGNAGALDSITLGSGLTYTLTTVDNNTNGANGLPVITSPIVINGNGSTITRNSEAQFRLFYNASIGNLTLNKVTLTNGFGDPGGAILSNGNLILNYVSVANNSSSSGGGIFINGTAAINNSAISGNQGLSPDGGGIFVNGDASLTLSNSTVAGNSAANTGGGIVTGLGSTVVVNIYNSTIANNVAAQGAGIMVWGGTVRVYNTIIANNFEQDGVTVGNCVGNVQAGSGFGSNLQWPDVTCTDEILTDDPLLGPLTGSPGYLPLGAGSPAIDAGDNTICAASPVNSIDQRGVARPANACDIGAVEATEVPALVAGTTGGAAALVNAAGTQDFVRFGDTTIGPIEGDQWRGDNVAIPSSPTFNIGRDPLGSDTNHVTDWLSQGSSAGGQNFAKAVINEVFTGTNDLVELYNPIIDTVDLSGWELTLYDSNDQVITLPNSGATTYTYRFPNGTLLRPGQFLVVAETNPGDGIYSILLGKDTINWDDWNATGAVALSNGVTGMDFVRFGGSGISPLTVDAPAGTVFTGIVPAPLPGESIGRNADSADTDTADDWYSQSPSVGQINPTLNPPDNDLFNNAIVINPLPFRDTGNTLSATAANDPLTSCGFSVGHTVWYKYTAANSNPVRFQTDGSDFNTVLAVFTLNSSTNTLQQVSGLCSRMDDEPGSRLTLNPTANTIYYVMIGGHLNTSGSYVFSANAPTNDDIDDTINIGTIADLPFRTFSLNAGGVPISNTNVTAASQLISDPLTSCATTVGRSVWYTYTAADATRLRLQTTGTSFDTVIAIYTGSLGENGKVDRTSLQEVACNNDDTSTTTSDMGFTPVPGTTYYIEVAGNSDAGGSLLFEVDVFPSPNNDLVENAYVVTPDTDPLRLGAFKVTTPDGTVNAPFAEDTTGATATDDATASCGLNLGGSVWFVYTDDIASDTPATVVFQTFASDYDTAMTIYTGTPDNLTEAACSDDVGVNQGSRLTLGVTDDGADVALVEGQTYYIRISGYFGETGNLTFNAFVPQVAAPTNDDPNTPYTIIFNSDNGSYTIDGVTDPLNIKPFVQDTTGTNPALEDAASKITCGQDVGHTVWYRYVAPENQRVVFDADGSDFDTVIAAFIEQTDGNLNSLVEVGCNDDFGSRPQSKLTLNTANGVILYVMFGGYKQDRGNLSLGVQQIVPVVTDFTLVNAGLIGDIRMLSNTDPNTLDLSALPAFTIRANTQPSEVGSVKFELHDFDSGALILNYMDDMPPYSLTGNDPDGGYIAWSSVTPGKYKLTATPYTAADGQGKIGTPQTITLIVNGSNAAPVIAADNTSIAVNEGLTALNSGTFSDADVGDTVSLSASVGTVTADLSDPEHPVWNWLFETSDGPADSQTVTITADDGHGHQTPTTFALVVNNVAPTATFTPVFISQNVRRLTFGAPVDVNADIPGIVYSYDCTFDNDGDSSNDDFDVTGVTTNSYDCTFPGPGNYTVRGRIADKDGGFSDYTADITISASNIAPTVNVGGDQNIQLPTNTVALLGVVSDDGLPTGSTLTYAWTVINNPPAPVVFSAPDALSTNATFTIAGTYTLQLSASDGQLTGSDTLTVVVAPADNVPPDAKAGTDQLVTDTAPYGSQDVTLDGSASTDSDGSIVGYAWTEGATLLASIVNPTIPLADGIHTITLTVTDDKGAIDTDDVIVEVRLPDNQAPSVNAGDDQNTQLPSASVSLAGTASDDGLPLPASLTYTWTAINTPPGPVVFSAANALSTNATFTVAGTYTLQLSVSDGQLSSSDTVTVSVNAASVIPPHADAGPDQTVADVAPFGTESVTLDGSASTDDGNIVSYVWTENAQVIANGVKPSIPLADGTHYITLTVTDDSGATATDDVIVMVQLPANQAPTVNAGSDQSIQLPVNSVALVGSVSDDGLPLPPTLTYTWTGPTGVNFSTPNALSTTATFSTAGTYILTLTASDGQLSGSDTVQIVVSSQSTGSNEVTDQVAKSSDDVNEDGSTYDATNPLLWFGTGQSTSKSYLGLRFTNLEIPKGATITEAHIEVYTASAQWINMRILIGADAVDNSATFTSATRPSTRTFSTARVDYRSNTPWMGGTWNDIGDVKAVIQEIVNRTGWQSGNSLAILIKGLGAQWGRKFVTSYDGDPAHAPRLVISYAGGPPPPNQPPVITLDNPSAVATALEGQPTNIITGTFGDPDNNPVTLTPSLGTLQIVGNTWSWSYTPPDGPVNTNVTITAKDSKGASALVPVTFGLTVTNVSPTAVFAAQPASTFPNNAVALTFSTPVDVAADLGSLTYSVDCGNGGVIQTTAPFSCTYASTGTFTALGTVADKDGGSNTYQAVITVNDVSTAPTTITPQVSASSDDVNQSGNTFQANLATIWVGTEGNAAQSYTGLRFNNLSIPVGATITEAHLEFYTTANTWINVDVLIAADATDNSVTFSNATRPSTRTFTTTRVTHHSNVQWLANSWNILTGNLAGVVQEVVSRAGWQSGNSLSIILKGIGSQWARKFVTSYEGNPAFAPRLVISYTPPAAPVAANDDPPVPLNLTLANPPSAAFAMGLSSGDAPLNIQFTDTSTGDIAGYAWDFGDGAASTDQNPAHIYTAAGSYTVILTVTGTDATTSAAQAVINVTAPVVVPTDTPPPPTDTPTEIPTEIATTPPPSDTPTDVPTEVATTPPPLAEQTAAP